MADAIKEVEVAMSRVALLHLAYARTLVEEYGEEQVHLWRRSYETNPPGGESLKNTCERTTPYFEKYILKDLHEGKTVLVSAHGNSLRAITMHVENISEQEIPNLEIPTGVPIVYTFDENMNLINKENL